MASERIVRIILTGDSAGAVRALEVAGAAAEKTQSKFERMQKVGKGMTSLGRSMVSFAAPLVGLGAYAVKSSMDYQQALTRIRTQTTAGAKEVSRQAAGLKRLGDQTGYTATELAQALYPIESNGLRASHAYDALAASAKGAKIGGDSLAVTADVLAGVLGAAPKDIHSATEAMMVMDKTVGLGKMHLQDLTAAMTTGVVQEGKTMGLGFRDIGAALAAMTKQGVPAEVAASRMKLTLTKMAAPTGAALKALQSIGLGQYTLANDLHKPHGLVTALADLRAHLQGLGKDQQTSVLSAAFGQSRGLANIAALLNVLPSIASNRNVLDRATAGQFVKRWAEQQKTPAQKFSEMMAKIKNSMISLGHALMPLVQQLLPKLVSLITGVVHWFTGLPKPVKDLIGEMVVFLAVGGPILMFFGKLITAIGTVGKVMEAMKLETIAASTVMKASIIGILIFALIELVTHFHQVGIIGRQVFSVLGHVIAAPFKAAWAAIKAVYHAIVSGIRWVVGQVKSGLNTLGFTGGGVMSYINPVGLIGHGLSAIGLANGGVVKPRYFDAGGPVGTDTVPAWLTPGEFVLRRATVARVGVPALQRLDAGGSMGTEVTVVPGQTVVQIDGRTVAQAVTRYTLQRNARGATSLVGGAMLTGSRTAG